MTCMAFILRLAFLFASVVLLMPPDALALTRSSVTVFAAPNPTSSYCEYTSYSYKTASGSTTYVNVHIYPGSSSSGKCVTTTDAPYLPAGQLAIGPSAYRLSISPDDYPKYITGRVQYCTALPTAISGTMMSCSESQFGTVTYTKTIPTTFTVQTIGITVTRTTTKETITTTFNGQAAWTAALAAQTTVTQPYSYTPSSTKTLNIGLILGIAIPIFVVVCVVSGWLRARRAGRFKNTLQWIKHENNYPSNQQTDQEELMERQARELAELRAAVQAQEMASMRNTMLQAQGNIYSPPPHPPPPPSGSQPYYPYPPSSSQMSMPMSPPQMPNFQHIPSPMSPQQMPQPMAPQQMPQPMSPQQMLQPMSPQQMQQPISQQLATPMHSPGPSSPLIPPSPQPEAHTPVPSEPPQPNNAELDLMQARIAQLEAEMRATSASVAQPPQPDVAPPPYRLQDGGT